MRICFAKYFWFSNFKIVKPEISFAFQKRSRTCEVPYYNPSLIYAPHFFQKRKTFKLNTKNASLSILSV